LIELLATRLAMLRRIIFAVMTYGAIPGGFFSYVVLYLVPWMFLIWVFHLFFGYGWGIGFKKGEG